MYDNKCSEIKVSLEAIKIGRKRSLMQLGYKPRQ